MSLPQNTHDKKIQLSETEEQTNFNDEVTVEPLEPVSEILSNKNAISDFAQTSISSENLTLPPTTASPLTEPSEGNDKSKSSTNLDKTLELAKENNESSMHPNAPPPPYSSSQYSPSQDYTSITITTQPLPIQYPSITSVNSRTQRDTSTSSRDFLQNSVPLKFCKICQEPELLDTSHDENENLHLPYTKDRLISPCKCKGSLEYVHLSCLNKWRNNPVRHDASYRCEVCKYEYKFYRPRLAKIVESPLFLHTMTATVFILVIYGISWIVKAIDMHIRDKNKPPSDSNAWTHTNILGVEALHLIIGISIMSLIGVCFLIINSCINGINSTRHEYCICGGYGTECSGCYWCIGCNGGDGGGFVVVLFFLIIISIFVIGIFGALSAGYLLIQKLSMIYLDRVKEKILEVKKD
ncbi:2896_t:CDS:1 [Acaulospora morrowiae]|uniref:2896_t:CDS:1 n=1 Tax=Acaulospora morrowiae TaxID=94023 RepID=A0A9N9B604_9GLOM|nr:2896_t:CDS:1 [Acaulospora morrowiae]